MKWRVILGVVIAMFIYAALGGVALYFVESSNETALRPVASQQLNNFLGKYACLSMTDMYTMTNIVNQFQEGGLQVGPVNDPLFNVSNWDIRAGIFLSFQIIGAIGYGNASPRTTGGRAFCVVFAIIGIPLFVIASFGIGDMIYHAWQRAVKRVRIHPLNKKHEVYSQVIRLLAMFVFGMIFFSLIPAAIFTAVESVYGGDTSYGDAIYYTLVIILTINFGDFTPGSTIDSDFRNWYRLCIGFWILITLLWFTATWTSVRYALEAKLQEPDESIQKVEGNPPRMNFVNVQMNSPDVPVTSQPITKPTGPDSQAPVVVGFDDKWKYPFNIGR